LEEGKNETWVVLHSGKSELKDREKKRARRNEKWFLICCEKGVFPSITHFTRYFFVQERDRERGRC
jgi:hypothetical protein